MTSMGEKMSEQEVEDMIKEAAPNGDGRVNYEGKMATMTCDLFLVTPKPILLTYPDLTVFLFDCLKNYSVFLICDAA